MRNSSATHCRVDPVASAAATRASAGVNPNAVARSEAAGRDLGSTGANVRIARAPRNGLRAAEGTANTRRTTGDRSRRLITIGSPPVNTVSWVVAGRHELLDQFFKSPSRVGIRQMQPLVPDTDVFVPHPLHGSVGIEDRPEAIDGYRGLQDRAECVHAAGKSDAPNSARQGRNVRQVMAQARQQPRFFFFRTGLAVSFVGGTAPNGPNPRETPPPPTSELQYGRCTHCKRVPSASPQVWRCPDP